MPTDPAPPRRWFRWSLRTMFVVVTLAALFIPLSQVGWRAWRESRAKAHLKAFGIALQNYHGNTLLYPRGDGPPTFIADEPAVRDGS